MYVNLMGQGQPKGGCPTWTLPVTTSSSRGHFLQAFTEVVFPAIGKGCDLKRLSHGICVIIRISFRDVKPSDFRNGQAIQVASYNFELIARADLPFTNHCDIETRASACQETLDHLVRLKSNSEFVTRKSGLRDDDFRGADREGVA